MDIKKIKEEMILMGQKTYDMLGLVEKGFMEHKLEYLSGAMEAENSINDMERALTTGILQLSKTQDKKELSRLQEMVTELERIGDEGANIVEQIEVKIGEKLLFSEKAIEQYNELYSAMKLSLEMMIIFLKARDAAIRERVIDNGFHVKELVERFRKEHAQRMLSEECNPHAGNIFCDMLDFVGNIARHCSNVVKA